MTLFLLRSCVTAVILAGAADGQSSDEMDFDYFRNSWNVIGLKDYADGTRVTPSNELLLGQGRVAQIRFGRQLLPLGRSHVKRLQDGWLPIILLAAEDGPVRYEIKLWATPLPTVADWRKAFDGPAEGENFLNWISVRAVNTGPDAAEARMEIAEGKPPATIVTQQGPLQPGQTSATVVRIPFLPVEDNRPFADADADEWLRRTAEYWQVAAAGAARIEVPCRKATESLLAAHVCQLIANDHGVLHGGEGFYDEFYIRDGGYQIMELEEAGLWDAARKAVEHYLNCQRPDGRFESQANQYDANGQALWVLWQYYKISGDRAWLERAYPHMRRAIDWLMQTRRQAPADSPFAGVLPAAPADGEFLWDGKHHIVGYDVWNLRGLLCTADAAGILGRTGEADELRKEADLYRAAIDAACKQTGLSHFPPSWEKAGTHWGNTETLWPTPIFSPDDPRVMSTIAHARNIHGGGFIEGTIQWLGGSPAIHPYMSAYTTMASLRRGEHEQVVEDFYWYLVHSSASHAYPEGIFPRRRFAWSDTIPHVTGASNYALMLRHMLVDERDDELHLLAAVPDWWLADSQTISVRRLPTHFGEMNLSVHGAAQGVRVEFTAPERQPPKRIVMYLPQSRPLLNQLAGVELVARPDQSQRWDFPGTVRLYRDTAGAAATAIPGLIPFPLAQRPDPARCRVLRLEAVANTDPFSAPFGVPNPGRFLFTGLQVGDRTVAEIPFHIIDPQRNEGRGLVVLDSPRAPQNIPWPKEVRLPVGQRGKRLFVLGNVHGWSVNDPGTGAWGTVAEYEIVYSDGSRQTVPLITGRTIDDWVSPLNADEVLPALRGDPWHLNLLAVQLRDQPIAEIVFRDLGTEAAPLLAAMTLEQ